MDCYFHHAVPSAAPCRSCGKAICATCRNDVGDCPGCVLAARIDAASAARARISGGVGASTPNDGRDTRWAPPPPQPEPQPQPSASRRHAETNDVRVRTVPEAATSIESPSTRALVALGYPFWPLALLALFDGSKNVAVRRHALQALAFSLVGWGIVPPVLAALAAFPLVGWPVVPLMTFWFPLVFVASAIYGFKAYHNERVDVPFVSEFLDARLTPDGYDSRRV
jgi:uncharacterized membrane protein